MAGKSFFQEFKEFAVKGNMMDLAIGIIIGTAFTRIINVLVQSVLMPAFGMVIGNFDFKHLEWVLRPKEMDAGGKVVDEGVIIKYGEFIQASFDFLIIALVIFAFIKFMNHWKKEAEDEQNPTVPTPKDIELLSEIRDLLKDKRTNI